MNLKVSRCQYSDVAHLKSLMAKERVTMVDTPSTWWYCARVDGKVVGVAALCVKKSVRFKSDYVLTEYRSSGIFDALFKMQYDEVPAGVKMTIFCTKMSIGTAKRYGFKPIRERNGITFMECVK